MGILDRLLHRSDAHSDRERQRVAAAAERIVVLSPHLRMARRYQAQLERAVAAALVYLDGIVAGVEPPREASTAAWALDPYIHAFFAAPDDIAPALSRSADLRAFFQQNPALDEAYGVLGMAMVEKNVLGVALEGEAIRRDVVLQTLSFSDHQVRMCGRSEPELREEIVRRLLDQLGLEGLSRYAADQSRRGVLEQERALLRMRLRLIERQGVGIRAMLDVDAPADPAELARLREQMVDNERNIASLGMRSDALDRELGQLCSVLAEPQQHIYVERRRARLNKMNVVIAENSTQEGNDITFEVARIPTDPPRMRAFTLVRLARADLLPATSLLDEASRLLG